MRERRADAVVGVKDKGRTASGLSDENDVEERER